MNNIIKDVSKLTTISEDALNKIIAKEIWCIGDSFEESLLNNEDITQVDIGVGILYITNTNENIKYKFIPNKKLEDALIDISINKKNPLQLTLEKKLCNKIINTYKDII